MISIKQTLIAAVEKLAAIDTARLDAEILLGHVLEKPRSYLFSWSEVELTPAQQSVFSALIAQRVAGKPVAYLVGVQEFWSLDFKVTEATLIPRPETEQLVDAVLALCPASPLILWDAGTGTGAIAVALASERPSWQIFASDYSAAALAVAAENISANKVAVNLCRGDWLQALAAQSLDVLVSNPPYIPPDDKHLVALTYEPHSALAAADEGLADIKKLIIQGLRVLKPGGRIFIEHGYDQGDVVPALLREYGYNHAMCEKDYAGQPRFSHARLSAKG
ncbi:MAG: peptide chain release factor N(5)-glutamine methyltransferase [Pseudomonadales bacterium]|nr:peptide chain release factor N(5)-glutamine methyltransferase [Pseudomonadales bacterium]